MTYRSKVVIFSAVLLGLCVTVTSFIWALGSRGAAQNPSIVVIIFAILISLASVCFVYYMKVRKNRIERLLDVDYYREYELVKDAIALSQLPPGLKKDITDDVLEMLITAQKSGRLVIDVIGNPQSFAEEIISSFAKPSSFLLLDLFDSGAFFSVFVLLTNLAIWLENTKSDFFDVKIEFSMLLLFLLISFMLIPLSKSLTSSKRNWAFLLPLAFGIAYIFVLEVLRRQFYSIEAASIFLDEGLIVIPNNLALAAFIVAIPLLMLLKSMCRRMLLKKV